MAFIFVCPKQNMTADENVIVDLEPADDAGGYRIIDDLALIRMVDFFTPVVDDPHAFGRITAANALSVVYAMGEVIMAGTDRMGSGDGVIGTKLMVNFRNTVSKPGSGPFLPRCSISPEGGFMPAANTMGSLGTLANKKLAI